MKEKTKIQETINLQSLKEAENFGILETTSRTVHDLQFERKTSREKKKKKNRTNRNYQSANCKNSLNPI